MQSTKWGDIFIGVKSDWQRIKSRFILEELKWIKKNGELDNSNIVAVGYLTISIVLDAWTYYWLIWVIYAVYRFVAK